MNKPRVAIIGGGVAGIAAAQYLQNDVEITLYEKNDYVGGHTNTIVIADGEDEGLAVDTGFIVLNDRTYPLLHELFELWGVKIRNSDMSFGFYCERTGLQYAGTGFQGLFADKHRLFEPSYLRFLYDIHAFGKRGLKDLENLGSDMSLGEYLAACGYSDRLIQDYILPMGAAIWSTPSMGMESFPAEVFLQFFRNHGLLNLRDRPQWQTVCGGSFQYVKAFLNQFKGTVVTARPIHGVRRTDDGVLLRFANGSLEQFDQVIFAVHADQVLGLLDNPTADEERLFSVWRYQPNQAILHTDESLLPPKRAAHASWNYRREIKGNDVQLSLTYHMNRLQGLTSEKEYCVTLNSAHAIDESSIVQEIPYMHPKFTREAIESREELQKLNGHLHTWYCGSYFRYGFHEDAVYSSRLLATRYLERLHQDSHPQSSEVNHSEAMP